MSTCAMYAGSAYLCQHRQFNVCAFVSLSHMVLQVIIDMTQKDPASRLSVSEYLDVLQGKVAGLDTSTSTAGVSSDFPSPPPLSDTSRFATRCQIVC